MNKWIIRDWMGHDVDLGKEEYESYGDARDAITQWAHELTDQAIENGKYERDSKEHEEAEEGIEGDLYAVYVDEKGNEQDGDYTL